MMEDRLVYAIFYKVEEFKQKGKDIVVEVKIYDDETGQLLTVYDVDYTGWTVTYDRKTGVKLGE